MAGTDTLNQCLMKRAAQFLPEDRSQTAISLDGKTIRSTTGMKNMSSWMQKETSQILKEISQYVQDDTLRKDMDCERQEAEWTYV